MTQGQTNRSATSSATWFTTRNLVIAFAIVEALGIGAVLFYGR